MPLDVELPAWAAFGSLSWRESGHQLIAPLVDACGATCSVLARRVRHGIGPKSVAARGYQRGGLVLACSLARQVLATGARPEWWPSSAPLRVEVSEGEKKWMMRVSLHSDANNLAPMCIGIESGSWTRAIAARIPDGAALFIATDPDEAGARYATTIVETFAERIASGAVHVELRDELELCGSTVRVVA